AFFVTVNAWGQSPNYGYLRVRITEPPNSAHNYPAKLLANGVVIVNRFCHSNRIDCNAGPLRGSDPYPWVALGPQHLSFHSSSTSVISKYDDLGFRNICEFDYAVDFSFDQQAITTFSGFRAPFSSGVGSIPLTTNCANPIMRVCSSDPAIQQKLEREYKRSLI